MKDKQQAWIRLQIVLDLLPEYYPYQFQSDLMLAIGHVFKGLHFPKDGGPIKHIKNCFLFKLILPCDDTDCQCLMEKSQ